MYHLHREKIMSSTPQRDHSEQSSSPTRSSSKGVRVRKRKRATGGPAWDSKKEKKSNFLATWTIGGLLLSLTIGIVVFFVSSHSQEQSTKKVEPEVVEEWQGLLPAEVAKRFIDATTIEERLKWVRDPKEVEPLMREFYQSGPGAAEKVLGVKNNGQAITEEFLIHRSTVQLEGEKRRTLSLPLINNRALVDFKCYARYCSASWPDLLEGKKSGAEEARVSLKLDSGYMGEFADEKKWISFLALTPDWEHPLYFYVERESIPGKKLEKINKSGWYPVSIAIRSLNNSHEKKQFEITHCHALDWCF